MKEKFKIIQDKFPLLSSCMCFIKLIKGKKLPKWEIEKWFNKLVDKDDWKGTPKKELIDWLKSEISK